MVDGNCRGKSVDTFHVGLVHLAQKLAGIGGQTFDVSALTFGKYCIKSKARFTTAGKTCKNYKLFAWDG